jgi:ACR3 family arsenite efflux pump ArsB
LETTQQTAKKLVWAIPISMVLGLVFGYLFDASPLKQFIVPVTFIMVYPMMVTLNVRTLFKGNDFKLQAVTLSPQQMALQNKDLCISLGRNPASQSPVRHA